MLVRHMSSWTGERLLLAERGRQLWLGLGGPKTHVKPDWVQIASGLREQNFG